MCEILLMPLDIPLEIFIDPDFTLNGVYSGYFIIIILSNIRLNSNLGIFIYNIAPIFAVFIAEFN